MEDAFAHGQRSKLERYSTHKFLSTHAVSIAPDSADLSISEISAFRLLDHVTDGHVDAVQQLGDWIEELEGLLFAERRQVRTVNRRLYALRRSLVRLRRVVLPMRAVVASLVRPGRAIVPLVPYYTDFYDHVLHSIKWTESVRESVASAM
ncbi:CorA family divalent cation transporter [Streptomyces sp. NBC_00467]|uniref:CorA family divalent cation transporter n=1 Tax=Streptomyces sp. NBC_00467 TaxID=2975752 RepID=UPI002E185268